MDGVFCIYKSLVLVGKRRETYSFVIYYLKIALRTKHEKIVSTYASFIDFLKRNNKSAIDDFS